MTHTPLLAQATVFKKLLQKNASTQEVAHFHTATNLASATQGITGNQLHAPEQHAKIW
jgi:hypothetical protein